MPSRRQHPKAQCGSGGEGASYSGFDSWNTSRKAVNRNDAAPVVCVFPRAFRGRQVSHDFNQHNNLVIISPLISGPLDCKEIQPVHPKGDQSWVFTGRTDAEAEIAIRWPPDSKSRLIRRDPDAGRD